MAAARLGYNMQKTRTRITCYSTYWGEGRGQVIIIYNFFIYSRGSRVKHDPVIAHATAAFKSSFSTPTLNTFPSQAPWRLLSV